ncbi:MAG TPA: GYF domain-containing protein [Candidatus Acidoferrum sp.]|nr:GYF domain-containing protein [Candidatus Acidoferrum sp.]
MYKILGSDGNEYDAMPAQTVKQWIREGRVEPKTPVMPEGAADWVFLSDLPEFAESFAARQKQQARASASGRGRWLAAGIGLLVVAIIIGLFILRKTKHL